MGPVPRYAAAALLLVPGPALYAQSDVSALRWGDAIAARFKIGEETLLEYEEREAASWPAK